MPPTAGGSLASVAATDAGTLTKSTAVSAVAESSCTGLAYGTPLAVCVRGAYPSGSDARSSETETAAPSATGTDRAPSAPVVNGLPETGWAFCVTARRTPLAGAHPLGGVPVLKYEVSAAAAGAAAHCSASTARPVGASVSLAGASWASEAAAARGTLTKSTAAPATAESICTGLA